MSENAAPRLLYCVLNWGLGHATRSIPVIRALIARGLIVEVASDGGPAKLLKKTFPALTHHTLPGYNIEYPSKNILINAISQMRHMIHGVKSEKQEIDKLFSEHHYDALISDNRYGCYHASVPSILITHQLRNLTRSDLLNKPAEWVVDGYFRHFDEIWVPDTPDRALTAKMTDMDSDKVRFIGHLSDQLHRPEEKRYDLAAVLSGPEPQRSYFEEEVLPQLEVFSGKTLLARGVIEDIPARTEKNVFIHPYLDREGVGHVLNSARVVVCRTGYSSLMDLMQVGVKAILVPTPGQPEQEFLGEMLANHPQFVVQKQGEIDLAAGYNILISRPDIQPFIEGNQELLNSALNGLRIAPTPQ